MLIRDAIKRTGLSLSQLAKATGISKTTIGRIVCDAEFPKRRNPDQMRRTITEVIRDHGVIAPIEWVPSHAHASSKNPAPKKHLPSVVIDTQEVDLMQLNPAVFRHFGLKTNPFLNDVETDSDVFVSKGYQMALDAFRTAIDERGFLAIVAQPGAGKTTAWDTIYGELERSPDVKICRPECMSKENLSPDHLVRALLWGLLGNETRMPRDAEQRGRMLSRALLDARGGVQDVNDKRVVLVIDDAHYCSTTVLRQLKTFYEEKVGRFRLLSIILIGLPELKPKLQRFPEIGNRIRLFEVPPVPVREYLEHKLRRVGAKIETLFDATGFDAFLSRFRNGKKAALGYPLDINTAVIRAMVKLHNSEPQPGERITREVVDSLPGGPTVQMGGAR